MGGLPPDAPLRRRLERALDLLEPHAGHPGTGRLHDPLYRWLRTGDDAHRAALGAALARAGDHPAAPALRALLAEDVDLPVPTLEGVLARHGPVGEGADPVAEVDRRLARTAEVRRVLEARLALVQAERDRAARTASAMAAVASMVAVIALLGWLAALGLWEIPWMEPPAPEEAPGER